MKKVLCMIALAAITFSTVYAGDIKFTPATMQQDTTKKMKKMKHKKMKMKKDSTMKDTSMKMR